MSQITEPNLNVSEITKKREREKYKYERKMERERKIEGKKKLLSI